MDLRGNSITWMGHASFRITTADGRTVTLFARDDMGAMLDLKLETVSREVSRLVKEAVLEPLDKQGRIYHLREPQRLMQAAA